MSPTEYEIDPDGLPPERRRNRPRSRIRGRGLWIGLGFVIAALIGVGLFLSFSRTSWGRAKVLTFTVEALGGRLNGGLQVDSLNGNLITGARLYGITLNDTVGQALASIDSAYIRYKLATLTGGDIVIGRLDVYGAEIHIFREPGDTLWNYEGILQDTSSTPETGDPSATLIESLNIYDGHVKVRLPLAVDSRLPPARQEEEMRIILADTARWMLEPFGDEDFMRVSLIDITEAQVDTLFIGPDERGGVYLQLVDAVADIRLWQEPPLEIRGLQGRLHLQEGLVNYDVANMRLPDSSGESKGIIDMRGERPLYDIYLLADTFALADIQWLYPWLPEDPEAGGGSGELWVEDREDGLLVVARDAVLEMPDTRITGKFGLVVDAVADEIRFVDVDLEAEPLRVESVEQLLPEDLPVEGLVIGGATIRGES